MFAVLTGASVANALYRNLSKFLAVSAVGGWEWSSRTMDGKGKAPPSVRRMWLVELGF